jgi:hypothetical protein
LLAFAGLVTEVPPKFRVYILECVLCKNDIANFLVLRGLASTGYVIETVMKRPMSKKPFISNVDLMFKVCLKRTHGKQVHGAFES